MKQATLLLIFCWLMFTSCVSMPSSLDEVTLYREAYSPKSPTEKIDIFRTLMPERGYVEIGEVRNRLPFDDDALEDLLMKARKIGADGIIILGSTETKSESTSILTTLHTTERKIGLKAVAIKYK